MIVVVAKDGRGCWIEFVGSVSQAKAKYRSNVREISSLGPLAEAAQRRPFDYNSLSGQDQWDIDKRLGILDWNGEPTS